MDRRGDYIPAATRNVFLKYYAPADRLQPHFWGDADKDAYLREIKKNWPHTCNDRYPHDHTASTRLRHLTSLAQLFSRPINGTQVQAIEIPLFQRDYAQGRKTSRHAMCANASLPTFAQRWTAMARAFTLTSSLATW
jgi:hypothetical protein